MRRALKLLVVVALAVVGPPEGGHYSWAGHYGVAHAQQDEQGSPRLQAEVTLLQINDVYTTVPINDVGGDSVKLHVVW